MSDEQDHFVRGPSGAHRWRRCPGSINAEKHLPDNARREAAQGTVFHEFAAMCVEFGLDPHHFETGRVYSQDGYEITYDEEMVVSMYAGLDFIRENLEPGDILFVEQKVDISSWAGHDDAGNPGFGTSDICIIKVAKRKLIIFDWKYGKGVPVSPVKSDQLYLYCLGCWKSFASRYFESPKNIEVDFVIEQPRALGGGGIWPTTMEEVLAEGERIKEDALATMAPNAPRIAGPKQCQFCKASGRCAEQAEYLLNAHGQKFEDISEAIELGVGPAFEKPRDMPLEVRSFVLLHWKSFKRWVDAIHALTIHDLKSGVQVPLLKAVEGRPGHRAYTDPAITGPVAAKLIEKVGEDKALETKLASPAVIEKLTGKKWFKENIGNKELGFVVQPRGKTILVPLEDKRPAIQDLVSSFDDLSDDEDGENED